MSKLLSVCAGAICLAATSSAHAQPKKSIKPQIVPECKIYTTNLHVDVCGYADLDDVKALYKFDTELVLRRAQVRLIEARVLEVIKQRDSYKTALEATRAAGAIVGAG